LDEEGYFAFDGHRVDDSELGRTLLNNMSVSSRGTLTTAMDGQTAFVEAFDSPLVIRHVRPGSPGFLEADGAYHSVYKMPLASLSTDEWDRFHGTTEKGLPLVFSRTAQVEFFDLLESFDDDSITIAGRKYLVPAWLNPVQDVDQENFWSELYRKEQEPPAWELGQPAPALSSVLPQLKLSRARVLVLGCGSGHDAAFLAQQGHVVTAVDFSPEAVTKAKNLYSFMDNLKFLQADAFQLSDRLNGQFDLVFEHTFYCAISPERRNEIVRLWKRMLHPQGQLLGIFFVMEKRTGPPFGGSEWEIRERLKKHFSFLFWTRWRHSIEGRRGCELVVFANRSP
jgi:SAM-dependent methyltransferase